MQIFKRIFVENAPKNPVNGRAVATNSTNDVTIIAAPGVGRFLYITDIIIANSSTTYTEIDIKDDSTIKTTYPAPSEAGALHRLGTPLKISADKPLKFACTVGVTSIKVSALGYVKSI